MSAAAQMIPGPGPGGPDNAMIAFRSNPNEITSIENHNDVCCLTAGDDFFLEINRLKPNHAVGGKGGLLRGKVGR